MKTHEYILQYMANKNTHNRDGGIHTEWLVTGSLIRGRQELAKVAEDLPSSEASLYQ